MRSVDRARSLVRPLWRAVAIGAVASLAALAVTALRGGGEAVPELAARPGGTKFQVIVQNVPDPSVTGIARLKAALGITFAQEGVWPPAVGDIPAVNSTADPPIATPRAQ